MKKYLAVGIPDEENARSGKHTTREKWEFYAEDYDEALEMAFDHFYYFHEVRVHEQEDNEEEDN